MANFIEENYVVFINKSCSKKSLIKARKFKNTVTRHFENISSLASSKVSKLGNH